MEAPRSLSMDEAEEVAKQFKEDLTRECERFVRRGDNQSALASIIAKEKIDQFIYALQLRAGSRLDTLKRPARVRPIHIPKALAEANHRRKKS